MIHGCRVTRRLAAALSVLVVGAGLVGCGSDDAVSGVDAEAAPEAKLYVPLMVDCLTEAGWTVSPTGDGGIEMDYPPDQADEYDAAHQKCLAETGFDRPPAPLSAGELNDLYDHFLEVRNCVVELGYTPERPVSRSDFVDSGGAAWGPYSGVAPSSPEEGAMIQRECPERPT